MSSDEFKGEVKQVMGKVQQTGEQVTEKAKTTVKQVTQRAETIAEKVANTSGKVIGIGLGKVANVMTGFTAGFHEGMRAGQQPKQTQEAPQAYVTEEEKRESDRDPNI